MTKFYVFVYMRKHNEYYEMTLLDKDNKPYNFEFRTEIEAENTLKTCYNIVYKNFYGISVIRHKEHFSGKISLQLRYSF